MGTSTRRAVIGAAAGGFLLGAVAACQVPARQAQAPASGAPAASAAEPKAAARAAPTRYKGWPTADYGAFPTLARDDASAPRPPTRPAIPAPLAGDPKRGAALVADRTRGGGCAACHVLPGQPLPGNVGPNLTNYGDWRRAEAYTYAYVYDARTVKPDTVMPPWGTNGLFSAAEIADIVAYLGTLKGELVELPGVENPDARPAPVEERDNLDPTVNPAVFALDDARALFEEKGPSGKACAECHAEPERSLRGVAARYPRWDAKLGRVLALEELIAGHAREATGREWPIQSEPNLAMSIFVRAQSNGLPVSVDTASPGAREAAARGEAMVRRKIGQLNFACVDCHRTAAMHWIRGQYLAEQPGQVPHFPTWRTSRAEIWDLRRRFQWCNVAVRANSLPPDAPEYGDLELYLTSLSNGLVIDAPGIRH